MNPRLHSGAVGLFCLGVLLVYAGWLGWKTPLDKPAIHCGDETCTEAHP